MEFSKIIESLVDKPLLKSDKKYLVDREKELLTLSDLVKYHPFGIFGLCGETGIGKTTILNMLNSDRIKKIQLSLAHRESKESILYDLLYKISSMLKNDRSQRLKEISRDTLDWIVEEVSIVKGASLSAPFIGGKIERQKMPRFNVFAAHEKLHSIIQSSVREYGKALLIVDELDKESKQDVLNVLDSLKYELQQDDLVVIFSLPYSIYREYRNDRMKWNESGNLENIIKDVVFLEELSDFDVKELLTKRLRELVRWFEKEALDLIVLFSDGNPRDALWMAQKVAFDNIHSKSIDKRRCEESIFKIMKEYMSDISLTQIQKKALVSIKDFVGNREDILKILDKNSIKRTTAYSTLGRLVSLGMIIERHGTYRISGKAKMYTSSID